MSEAAGGAAVRAAAARVVHAVAAEGRSLDTTLQKVEKNVAAGERPLLRFLAYEVLRHHWRLSAQVEALLSKPLKRRDRIIAALLAVGLLQLSETRVAPHAAVSLTVDAARELGRPQLAPLVNALLRRFQRTPPALGDDDEVRYEHPRWMLSRLRRDWPQHWREIVAANNARAPMWLRVNLRMGSREQYLGLLAAESPPPASVLDGLDAALRLTTPCAVESLPGFRSGRVSVQDGAAQLAAPWLLAGDGQHVLDACAAPGGKTGHLLELLPPQAALTAIDSDAGRLERVQETMARLAVHATVRAADASKPRTWWDGTSYDRILLDAPCSASGVVRRHPDIRLNRRDSDIAVLAMTQRKLLEALWPLLAAGGRLLYVTCSVFAGENEAVVQRFLESCADAQENTVLPNNNIRALMHRRSVGFQVLPGQAGLDGFYFACLEKSDDVSA